MTCQAPKSKAKLCLVLWCFLFFLSTQFSPVLSNSELETPDSTYVNYLPDCTNEDTKSNLFIVSTLDGKISVIDAIDGNLQWSKQITSGPLLSSSISDFMVNNKGDIVRIVPSLDGNLFVHNGRTIKQTPFSTEKLLKSSLKFSENVLLVGGQENRIIGLNLQDGTVAYECGFKGCSQVENMTFDDVVLLKKTTQSVRAINSLSGKEEWHFVVNDPQLLNVANQQCHNGNPNGQSKYSVEFKVIVPSGFVYSSVYYLDELATKQLHKEWDIKFDSPIVNVWHYEHGKLEQVNLFNRDTIGIKSMYVDSKEHLVDSDQDQLRLLNKDNTIDEANLNEPDFYIGSHNNQLYIQKSPFQKKQTSLLAPEDTELSDLSEQNTAIVQVEWKQPPAAAALPTESSKNVADKFEISTKLSFPFLTFNKLNSTGYYIFKLNQSINSNKCDRITTEQEEVIIEHEPDNIINEIVYASLSYYWKEIVVICLLSWVILNFCTSIFKTYALAPIQNYLWPNKSGLNNDENENKDTSSSNVKEVEETENNIHPVVQPVANTYNSRYLQDFEQIRLLGKGGFGLVFEAKHKIDEGYYAVKRISIPSQKEKRERFMREIRVLSKLNHSGIVRYYNAWIEVPPIGWQEKQDKLHNLDMTECFTEGYSLTENGDSLVSYNQRLSTTPHKVADLPRGCLSNNSLEIVFEDSGHKEKTEAIWSDVGENRFLEQKELSTSSSDSSSGGSLKESEYRVKIPLKLRPVPSPKVYVYIQMQLCQKETLKDWLLENNNRDKCQVLRIFTQLIDAVHYVHSNKLIHRDLKPSNIFFSMDGLVKIGDFGLVTNTIEDHCEADIAAGKSRNKLLKHTNDVGTQLYMSPEQVKNEPYDHKVDIFSMGIILYELLQSFNTESERILTLNRIRNKRLPPEFIERHTKESQVLQKLLSLKPNERPEAFDLLSEDIFSKAKQAT